MTKEGLAECPHCGNRTVHEIKYDLAVNEVIDEDEGIVVEVLHLLTQCRTCGSVSLFFHWEPDYPLDQRDLLKGASLLYPAKRRISDDVPEMIRSIYKAAKRIEKIHPGAFVVELRKIIEYLCKDKEAKGKTLKDQLDDLASRGIIPEVLSRMTNAIRYFGNLGAHANDGKISAGEAVTIDEFVLSVLDYVYIAPAKIKKLLEKIKG